MKKFSITITLLALAFLTSTCDSKKENENLQLNETVKKTALYDTIVQMDSLLFAAFNTQNLDQLMSMFSEDLEFYHDLGGATNYQQNLEAFRKNFEGSRRIRRELVPGSVIVDSIKGYGAVQTGEHLFYGKEPAQDEKLSGEAKFVHLWERKDGKWKITRIISYAHREKSQ